MTKKIPLSRGAFAIVDDADYEKVCDIRWYLNPYGYAATGRWNKVTKKTDQLQMTRILLGAPKGCEVDHINHDTLDNRRENLRIVTHAQNIRNMKRKKPGRSGYKGVSIVTGYSDRYRVSLMHDYKTIYIMTGMDAEECAWIYDQVAMQLFGDYSHTNFDWS